MSDIFTEYAALDADIKAKDAKKKELRAQILKHIVENGKEPVTTPFGKFTYKPTKSWKYPQDVIDAVEAADGLKAKSEETGDATCTITDSFTYNPVKI